MSTRRILASPISTEACQRSKGLLPGACIACWQLRLATAPGHWPLATAYVTAGALAVAKSDRRAGVIKQLVAQLVASLLLTHRSYERLRTSCLSIQPMARPLRRGYGGCRRDENGLQTLFEEKHDLLSGHVGPQDPLHADLFK